MNRRQPLRRTTPLQRKTPMRAVSKKQAAILKQYTPLRKRFLQENPVCMICRKDRATDVHHKAGRGPNMLRVETWAAACRPCHDLQHSNPNQARKDGWLI